MHLISLFYGDIPPIGGVIFSLRESDMETIGFSDMIFASKIGEGNITCRKANTPEKACFGMLFLVVVLL